MENRTEHFSEEKIYCHTYDGLVREMASAMEVDSQKLFPKTEGEFDHEDIESWIGAVKFKEGKVPDIQASLSSDRGLRVIKFEVADQKGIESLDEKATKEELIYSMALTEAKMKVVSDIAEEVYPAVAFQIKDYRREIERVREEILGDKRENTSLDEVIHGVMSKKTLAAAVIIGGMVLSACGVSVEIVTPNATATETQPRVTETVDIGATETPFQPGVTETAPGATETPTLEVTPTATEVTVRTEFARGEVMTPEEIKVNVDWYYNLSDEDLNQLTQGKLWSFSEYKGDSRPRDINGNILSETQDLGYVYTIREEIKDWGTIGDIEFYNAVFLGLTKVKDENGIEYFVGALGMKDAKGERMVAYGMYGVVNEGQVGGAIYHSSLYSGVRYFGKNMALPYNEDEYAQKLLNEQTKKVVLLALGQIIEKGLYSPSKEITLLEKTNGDEALLEMLKSQYAGGVESPKTYFEETLGVNGTLPLEYTKESMVKLARITLLGVDE